MIVLEQRPDDEGYVPFECTYKFDGHTWGITIYAKTLEEAEMKLRAVGKGTVDGRLMAIVPANRDGSPAETCPTCGKYL